MIRNIFGTVRILATAALLVASTSALATNGYFTHGVGTESKGMAGTGIGSDAMSGPIVAASNPALSVFADDGWEIGLSVFSPMRSYSATPSLANGQGGAFTVGGVNFDSGSEFFPIPYAAKNWRLNNGNVISTVFYGRGGMNTDWDDLSAAATSQICDPIGQSVISGPGPFCSGKAGVDLSQAFLVVSYSGGTAGRFSWGIGPVFAVQSFEAKGISSFTPFTKTFAESILSGGGPVPADSLSNNGHEVSTGFGGVAGVWWALTDAVSVGLAYQSKIAMSEFDDYADLFAEAGDFDIPSSAKFGLSVKGMNNARLNIDIEHTQFGEVDSVGNPMANLFDCPTAGLGGTDLEACLGGANGGGFGWNDMTTYKLGVEVLANDRTTWRFGYSFGDQPIEGTDVTFNILAPGVMEEHLTIGVTRKRTNGAAWNFSLMFAPSNTIEGTNAFDPTQTIELEMKQFEFEVSYLF